MFLKLIQHQQSWNNIHQPRPRRAQLILAEGFFSKRKILIAKHPNDENKNMDSTKEHISVHTSARHK